MQSEGMRAGGPAREGWLSEVSGFDPGHGGEGGLFKRLVTDRIALGVLLLIALTGAAVLGALKLRVDFGIELLFPTSDPARGEYDAFKEHFPLEDAHALILLRAPDVFTPSGLKRLEALEGDLGRLRFGPLDPETQRPRGLVVDTQSLLSVEDVIDQDDELTVAPLLASSDPTPAELARARAQATEDPLFAWRIAPPDGSSTTIRVTLDAASARDQTLRTAFLGALRDVLAKHEALARGAGAEQELIASGLPVIRAAGIELVNHDMAVLMPVAYGLIALLLLVTFAHFGEMLATMLTVGASVAWTYGVIGWLEIPLQTLTATTPLVVMIISVSDTAHIIAHYREGVAAGVSRPDSIAAALREAAVPCLLTELVIAGGFLSLLSADMAMIKQFGLATALGVLLAWLANMLALPLLLLAFGSRVVPEGESRSLRALRGVVAGVERIVRERPRAVFVCAALITAGALLLGSRVGREYYNFDDIPETTEIKRSLRAVEAVHGGVVPLVLFVRPTGELAESPEPLTDPRAIALLARLEAHLAQFPEVKATLSPATFLRRAHELLSGDASSAALPETRAQVAQELLLIDDGELLEDVLTIPRDAACVIAYMPDRGSTRAREILAEIEAFLPEATADLPFEVTVTGNYVIADAVYRSLVGGLLLSLALAVAVTFVFFCFVLRSWRLALIGLVPNLLPLALTLGVMSLLRIDLKPTTVIVFSITLVIADDDTIQYLARFRRRYDELFALGAPDLHRQAAFEVLRSTGPPMLVTTLVITLGFLCLRFSVFQGIGHLGTLIGVSLLTALAADLFLSPLLLIAIRPKIGGRALPAAPSAEQPSAPPEADDAPPLG